jgi:hypothetical protein
MDGTTLIKVTCPRAGISIGSILLFTTFEVGNG